MTNQAADLPSLSLCRSVWSAGARGRAAPRRSVSAASRSAGQVSERGRGGRNAPSSASAALEGVCGESSGLTAASRVEVGSPREVKRAPHGLALYERGRQPI